MSVSSDEILDLANSLLDSDLESFHRSSASRAYYAVFHMIKSAALVCPDNSHFVVKSGTHGVLIDRFLNWQTTNPEHKKIGLQIGYALKDMKRTRELADYEIDGVFLKTQAQVRVSQYQALKKIILSIWDTSINNENSS